MERHLGFLRDIWAIQGMIPGSGYFSFLATLSRPGLLFKAYPLSTGVQLPFAHQPQDKDLFFTPNLFTVPKRMNEYAHGLQFLYADLDYAPYPDLEPTYYWETSLGSYQALWRVTGHVTLNRWTALNRAMTRKTGADANGWAPAKVLRVPGSYNWKRGGQIVSEATRQDVAYTPQFLYEYLSTDMVNYADVAAGEYPPTPDPQDKEEMLLNAWNYLGLLAKSMLSVDMPKDRSLHIVKTARQLAREGAISPEVAFELIWVQEWCKWRVDGHKPEMLWKEVMAAYGV